MITQKIIAECYQPLFDHMFCEYGIILTISEMDDIISLAKKVNENLNVKETKQNCSTNAQKMNYGNNDNR